MGTLNLYADRPIRVGDLCRYGEDSSPDWQRIGTVEEIGLRSTRIRGLDRTVTTIPNADFSNIHIVNLTERDCMLLNTTLGLRYETTRDQLRFVLAGLRELLHAHPKTIHTADDPIRVRFDRYGDYSLNVWIRVYIRTSSFNEFLAIKEDIMLRVMEVVELVVQIHGAGVPGARALQVDSNRATGGGIAGRTGIGRWVPATGSTTAAPPIPEIRLSGQTISAVRGDNGWIYDLIPAHRIRCPFGTSFRMRHNCAPFVDVCSLGANHVDDPLLGLRRYRYRLESAAADLGQVSSGQGRHGNQGGVEQGQRLMPLRGGFFGRFKRIVKEIGRETGPASKVPR